MKKYVVVAMIFLAIILATYEINAEENAIRNAKIEITGIDFGRFTEKYMEINIHLNIINNESREIKIEGKFHVFILNVSVGDAKMKASVESHSSQQLIIPLRLYYDKVAEGIVNSIKSGNFNLTLKGKITGKVFFGLLTYSQNIEATWQ
ncbi:MAG: hypothetical protein FE045_00060 [Thermoplasmata archaeon]|jgi:LEA14-like dessication related protein|nr:MAG: hypothetical protein FE045_00060 [Thermoplasmata archaeon]